MRVEATNLRIGNFPIAAEPLCLHHAKAWVGTRRGMLVHRANMFFRTSLELLFSWLGSKLNNMKIFERCTKGGLVASALPVIFCAFVLGPTATSLSLVANFSDLSSHFETYFPLRLFVVSDAYPTLFVVQCYAARFCMLNSKKRCGALIAWSGLIIFIFSLLSIGPYW